MADYSVAQCESQRLEIACLQREVQRLTAAWHAEMETEAELRREVERLRDECDWLRRKLAVHEGDLAKAGGDDE